MPKSYRKNNKKYKLYSKYDKKKKGYLTQKEINLLILKEFHIKYNENILNSLMNIWGKTIKNKKVITYPIFQKLFQKPDGFFRNIYIK